MRVSVYVEDLSVDEAGALVEGIRDLKKLSKGGMTAGESSRKMAAEAKKDLPPPPAVEKPALTPAVVKVAQELGVSEDSWAAIPGTGKDGRITQGDVKKFAAAHAGKAPALTELPGVAPDSEHSGDSETVQPTLENARAALKELNTAKGMPVCIALLKEFKVPKVGDLAPPYFGMFIDAATKAAAE